MYDFVKKLVVKKNMESKKLITIIINNYNNNTDFSDFNELCLPTSFVFVFPFFFFGACL